MKTMQEKTCLSPLSVFQQCARAETQQTKDDNVVYLNTIQSSWREKKSMSFIS